MIAIHAYHTKFNSFLAVANQLKGQVVESLKRDAFDERNISDTDDTIREKTKTLAEKGLGKLREKIEATFPNAEYANLRELYLGRIASDFLSPLVVRKEIALVLKSQTGKQL